jgi:hypothetical protein
MADRSGCEETRALAAELALGVAAGDERATAVRHLEGCPTCRDHVAALAGVLDELLLLSPEREPAPGFESRVLAQMVRPRRARRGRRIMALSVAVAAAAVLAGGSVWLATQSDRQTANLFRTALERAGGTYFGVEFLHTPGGMRVGHAFVYGGTPSWFFVVIRDASRAGTFDVDVVTHAGETLPAGSLELTSDNGGAGLSLPIDLREISTIRLVSSDGGEVLEAELPKPPSASD